MNKSQLAFFGVLLCIVILIARCNSKRKSLAENPAPVATSTSQVRSPSLAPAPGLSATTAETRHPQPSQSPSSDFQKVADRVGPAVISLSVFDPSGKLLRTGTGFFVSHYGRFVTSSSIVEGAAHAVAKVRDGRILNVDGILTDEKGLDLAVGKAETKKGVPFVVLSKDALLETGTRMALIGSPLNRRQPALFETTISAKRSDQSDEWVELAAPISNELIGSPVVNDKGEIIGVATSQHSPGAVVNVVRTANTLDLLLARIERHTRAAWQMAENPFDESPPAPAEAPPAPLRNPKIPLAGAAPAGNSRLIYSPIPQYPTEARHSYFPLKGTGRFRVTFASNGQVKDVEVIQSTRSQTLDSAATEALRRWKSKPGQEWSANVPITFQP
jgi:TonB family protein